jgi:hypothetical protein
MAPGKIRLILSSGAFLFFCELVATGLTFSLQVFCENPVLRQQVERIGKSKFHYFEAFFDYEYGDTFRIYIAKSESEFATLTRGRVPEWGVGVALLGSRTIVMRQPENLIVSPEFKRILIHEAAHLGLDVASGYRWVPRWIHEGFAMWQSQEWRLGQDLLLAKALVTGSFIPLSELDEVNQFHRAKAGLAYTESFLALNFFVDEFGRQGFVEFVTLLREGTPFTESFFRATGLSYWEFQRLFESYAKHKYHILFVLTDPSILWILLVLLFVMAFIWKKRQNRKRLKEWERMERLGREFPYDDKKD